MERARLLQARQGNAAAEPDYRWVAVHAPSTTDGRDATSALERMKRPLQPKERLQVIDGLTSAGSPEAVGEIERMSKEPAAPKPELTQKRAMALFKARSYADAAKAFQAAAKGPGKAGHDAEEWFYAARSLARAEQDDEAIKTYLNVATRYRKSQWAEKAQYQAARLYLQSGRFREATKAYTTYLTTYKKGPLAKMPSTSAPSPSSPRARPWPRARASPSRPARPPATRPPSCASSRAWPPCAPEISPAPPRSGPSSPATPRSRGPR